MIKLRLLTLSLSLGLFISSSFAQTDFQRVYDLFQAKCAGCHGGAAPQGNLDLTTPPTTLYNQLINATPTNPTAAANGQKLVAPGRLDQSFLLKKIAYAEWDDYYGELVVQEGAIMPPPPLPQLEKSEVELVRQWIINGATQNDTDVSMDVIEEYYADGGAPFIDRPDPPAAGEGFQIRLGPFFMEPGEEREYFYYWDIDLPGDIEVNRTDVIMNEESHHFILYWGNENNFIPYYGLIPLDEADDLGAMEDESIVAAWQNSHPIELPDKTAFIWDDETILDLNFHIKNYSSTLVLPCEAYINIYTQPAGTAEEEMLASLFPIGLTSGQGLYIPAGGNEVTITDVLKTNGSYPIYIWSLSSHTHKTGSDYDIFLRNPNGTKGEQIYEGFFNQDYTFNQGYYDWEHPPIRDFDQPLLVDLQDGLIHEAKYINDTGSPLTWGATTDDEMMLFYAHYTLNNVVDTEEPDALAPEGLLEISPNPFTDETYITYELNQAAKVNLEVYDLLGKRVATLVDEQQSVGRQQINFAPDATLAKGLYLARISVNGQIMTKKFAYH